MLSPTRSALTLSTSITLENRAVLIPDSIDEQRPENVRLFQIDAFQCFQLSDIFFITDQFPSKTESPSIAFPPAPFSEVNC